MSFTSRQPSAITTAPLLRCFHAGDEAPRFVLPTALGRPQAARGPLADMDFVIGDAALAQSSAGMALSYPMKSGIISDFDACEAIWQAANRREGLVSTWARSAEGTVCSPSSLPARAPMQPAGSASRFSASACADMQGRRSCTT